MAMEGLSREETLGTSFVGASHFTGWSWQTLRRRTLEEGAKNVRCERYWQVHTAGICSPSVVSYSNCKLSRCLANFPGGFSSVNLGNPYVGADNGLEICESF